MLACLARAPRTICDFVLESPEFCETRHALFFAVDNRGANLLRYSIRDTRYFYDFQTHSPRIFRRVLEILCDYYNAAQRAKLQVMLNSVIA